MKIKKIFFIFEPIIYVIAYFLFQTNINMHINGNHYEFLVSDFFLFCFIFFCIQFIIFIVFRKFIYNKKILVLAECLPIFAFKVWQLWFVIIGLIIFGILYKNKNENVNLFIDIFVTLFGFAAVFFLIFNINAVYNMISFCSREKTYDNSLKVKVDKEKEHPNIYWIHMDGMTNLDFIKKYYNNDLSEFNNYLSDYYVNPKASFKAGHCTTLALNALFNPNYYDNYFGDYLDELDYCSLNNCLTKDTFSFKEMISKRMNGELFKALKKADYSIIGITEFNQYSLIPADYVYNLTDIDKKNEIFYFKNTYSDDDIYKQVLKNHRIGVVRHFSKIDLNDDLYIDKKINTDIDIPKYKYLNNTSFVPLKAIVKSIDDSKDKDKKSKFYFIDNTLVHLTWNYDENGKKLGDHVSDLDNYDNNYIYATKTLMELLDYIREDDQDAIIIVQGDHGIHVLDSDIMKKYFKIDDKEVLDIRNSTINAVYVPDKYLNGDEEYLQNPLNISRYLVNNFVGENYKYIDIKK